MSNAETHVPSARAQAFLDSVASPKYERHSVNGLKPFLECGQVGWPNQDGEILSWYLQCIYATTVATLREVQRWQNTRTKRGARDRHS